MFLLADECCSIFHQKDCSIGLCGFPAGHMTAYHIAVNLYRCIDTNIYCDTYIAISWLVIMADSQIIVSVTVPYLGFWDQD